MSAKDPDARWQSARDLHDELQWLGEGGTQATAAAAAIAQPKRRGYLAPAAAAASLAIGAAGMWVYTTTTVPALLPTYVDVSTPATADPFSFALSPDGRRLAFVANDERGVLLWVRRLDEPTPTPIPGTEGASHPFWALDGRALGFFAGGKLLRVDPAGGAPETLADAPIGRGGTWNTDGDIVFAATSTTGLMRVPATGGAVVPVTQVTAGQSVHAWPQFLPYGRRFLFSGQGFRKRAASTSPRSTAVRRYEFCRAPTGQPRTRRQDTCSQHLKAVSRSAASMPHKAQRAQSLFHWRSGTAAGAVRSGRPAHSP